MMEKLGRGFANVAFSVSEVLDSNYELLQEKGPTYAYSVGLTQGLSRTEKRQRNFAAGPA